MSNTPETDKAERMAFASEYMVPTEFAKELERQRNEAREVAKEADAGHDMAIADLAKCERERDEAREVLQEIANASHFDNIGNWARNKARQALEELK